MDGAKAEEEAQGDAEEPEAAQVDEHGHAGVAGTAEDAGGDGLGAIEELEHAGNGQQCRGQGNGGDVVGVQVREPVRDERGTPGW